MEKTWTNKHMLTAIAHFKTAKMVNVILLKTAR